MRIPDSALSTVCFICVNVQTDHGDGVFFIGTGFFIHLPSRVPNKYFRYLVTARHVIEGAKAAGYSEFFIRLNTVDGSSIVAFLPDGWLYPENPAIDVAVMPITIHDRSVKYADIPAASFATDEVIRDYGIGVGDDLVMVGLFTHRWGHQRNIPIVRSGIIASMPEEPFIDESGNLYDAYLVEMRSIGGLSGSPVFVWLNEWRNYPDVEDFKREYLRWQMRLIGIVRGHWELDGRNSAGDSLEVGLERDEIDRLNTGIAQVTPIKDVLAIINTEELVKERQEKESEVLKNFNRL